MLADWIASAVLTRAHAEMVEAVGDARLQGILVARGEREALEMHIRRLVRLVGEDDVLVLNTERGDGYHVCIRRNPIARDLIAKRNQITVQSDYVTYLRTKQHLSSILLLFARGCQTSTRGTYQFYNTQKRETPDNLGGNCI